MIREHWEERFKKRLELSLSKEEDYGSKDTPNANFHRVAELCRILKVDITRSEGAAQFHIIHKLDRICNLLQDGRAPNNEGVGDTLADMQNYIDILQDILHGKKGYWYRTVPPQSPEDLLQEEERWWEEEGEGWGNECKIGVCEDCGSIQDNR